MSEVNLLSSKFKANPFPFYAQLRETSPIYRAKMGNRKVWLVTRHEDVQRLTRDTRFVKDRRNITGAKQKDPWVPALLRPLMHNMLDLDEPDHRRLKTLVHQAFTPRRIDQMKDSIREITTTLLDRMEQKNQLELIRDFALPLPITVITRILGVPEEDQMKFHHWTKAILKAPTELNMLLSLPQLSGMMGYLRNLLVQRRAHPKDDLISALVGAQEAGDQLSEDECLAMVFLLLVAGHETTVNLIASGTLALLEHPAEKRRLQSDFSLIGTAVEELARYAPPVDTLTERYAQEDLELLGSPVKAGEMVLGVIVSANRDERVFKDPDTLDLDRHPNPHLSYGHGMHYCLGATLARMDTGLALKMLLERFPDLHLSGTVSDLRWRSTFAIRGLERLPVEV